MAQATHPPARIEYLRVKNYRALRDVRLADLTPLTVLLGPTAAASRPSSTSSNSPRSASLEYRRGHGSAVSGDEPDESGSRIETPLRSPDLIAVNTLGQFAEHPRVAALREFITDWYVSYLSVDDPRGQPEAGPQERLSKTGDNLANVVQYLKEQHPERLNAIFARLRRRVPRLEKVLAEPMRDGRLLLQIKDAPFEEPILSRYASDGTLKMRKRSRLYGAASMT